MSRVFLLHGMRRRVARTATHHVMPRRLRLALLGCVALTFGYLLRHVTEPLRLNLGDPSADATVLASLADHRSIGHLPLAALLYRDLARLGISGIVVFRVFALVASALAVWSLFQYVRRLWTDNVAVVAAALFTANVLWMMHADSLDQAPITQATGFIALWGFVRAIETRHVGHVGAAVVAALACCAVSYDYWLFLPAAALFTVHVRLGDPLAPGARRLLIAFAGACAAGMAARLAYESASAPAVLVADLLHYNASSHPGSLQTLIRRWTVVLTPMFWITVGYTLWRIARRPSLASLLEEGWMLLAALALLLATWQRAGSQMVTSHVLLPFYAIASATLIARLLDGTPRRRVLALAWLAIAPLLSFYVMVTHTRSVVDRDDLAKVETYLAANDRNDFVMSNLLSDMPIQAVFGRHNLAAPDQFDTRLAYLEVLDVLAATGTDYVDALIFTTPDSRFVDESLQTIMGSHHWWAITGWPYLQRDKTDATIAEYDRRVLANLAAAGAKQVLHASTLDIYRLDRASVLDAVGRTIPVTRELDFGSTDTNMVRLLGWGHPWLMVKDGVRVTSVDGYRPCAELASQPVDSGAGGNACETVPTARGLAVMDRGFAPQAQLMIRAERACDLQLSFQLAAPSVLALSAQDFTTEQCTPASRITFVIPARSVRTGVNLITVEKKRIVGDEHEDARADVRALVIEPICDQAP